MLHGQAAVGSIIRLNLVVFPLKEIRCRLLLLLQQGLAVPGEMVGTVAAQSIGEPTTQM